MKEAEKRVKDYCKSIINNKIPSCIYVKKAIKRFLNELRREKDQGFDYEMDWSYVQSFYDFSKTIILPDSGKNLQLLDWQLFIHSNLLGWKYKNNKEKRRFRSGAVYVPRKNGKTTGIMYPLLLWDFLTIDSAESYFFEKDGRQSEKMFNDLKQIILNDDYLSRECNILTFDIKYKNSKIAYFSSESIGIDGYKPSLAIIDEFWCFDNERAVTAMRYGGRSRLNNLTLIITTAGTDISLPAYAEEEKVKKMLNGILTDDTYFGIIHSVDEEDDWKKSESYIKANPSIDAIIDRKILEQDLQDALSTTSHQPDYIAKTLNRWTSENLSWISLQKWEKSQPENIDFDLFKELNCYGSLDLSSVGDFTAYSLCFPKDGKYYFKHRFYIPEETLFERYKKENIGILEWTQKGIVKAIQGETIDYDVILNDVKQDYATYKIKEVAYDPWGSRDLVNKINDEMNNIVLIPYSQSLKQLSQPTKQYEKLILEGKIIDPNPVIKWMVQNVKMKPDANGNYKPLKDYKASTKRIDGIITSIISLDRAMENKGMETKRDFSDLLSLFK
jgi:phage terminase large subunit-like protein